MAARVLLLMALTGLFAAAWNSDSPQAAAAPQSSLARIPEFENVADELHEGLIVSQTSQVITYSLEFDLAGVSLPELIAPGTYRVIDVQGRVGWMTIPVADQTTIPNDEPETIYTTQSESGRWYFIRVATAPTTTALQTGRAVRR
jgi:hypothetical protein